MLRTALLISLLAAGAALAAPAPTLRLSFPVACRLGETCEIQNYVDRDATKGAWRDFRSGRVTYDDHNGVDIRVPSLAAQKRGVAVLAAADGAVLRLRDGVPDISVTAPGRREAIQNAECGNAVVIGHPGGWETQYCHMAQGSLKVKVGDRVGAGQPLGDIGLSGNTEYPHLHFTVRRGAEVVDPFDVEGVSLWTETPAYQTGTILNVGFLSEPATMPLIEAGDAPAPTTASPVLVAYGRAIGLRAGDVQALVLKGPEGTVVAENRAQPLPRDQAQNMSFVGRRRPPAGWPRGLYVAEYQIWRADKLLVSRTVSTTL